MEGISVRPYTPNTGKNVYMKSAADENTSSISENSVTLNTATAPISTDKEEKSADKKKLKNILIGSGIALVVGGYTAAFYRKNILDFVSNFIKKGYLKAEVLKNKTKEQTTFLEVLSVKAARFLDKTLTRSQMFVNFSAMKDSFADKVARTLKLGPLCDKLAQTWDSLATKAVLSNYKKCDKSFNQTKQVIFNKLDEIKNTEDISRIVNINGENYTVEQLLKLIQINTSEAQQLYNKNFSKEAFSSRKQFLLERLKDINKKFFNEYTTLDYYLKGNVTRFTVEEWLAPIKTSYQDYLFRNKSIISNNIDDKFAATYKLLKNFDKVIAPDDTKSRGILKEIIHELKQYRSLSGLDENISRETLVQNIEAKIQSIITQMKENPMYKEKSFDEITKLAQNIANTVMAGEKGKLQEALTYLKALLPRNEYLKIRRQVYKTSEQLNKVTNAEGDLYFDKLRDITLGSALTDITFGMVSPLAMMGVVIAADDTAKERISSTLKLGIPLLGGIATSTAFLFMLASGGRAMALSALSGLILNRLGTLADNALNTHQEQKNPKLNAVVNNINTSSTFLASGGTSYFINQAAEKGLKTAEHYANEQIIKKLPINKQHSTHKSEQAEPPKTDKNA